MENLLPISTQFAWPLVLALAWVIGEFGHRYSGLPRISFYALVGFLLAQLPPTVWQPGDTSSLLLLANVALGLILFEFAYRINLRWLYLNPWLTLTGVLEACATFAAVFFIAQWHGSALLPSLLLAALAMSTSPAGVLLVINERRSSGQVTERSLHLAAINYVLAVFVFKLVVGVWVLQTAVDPLQAVYGNLLLLLAPLALGCLFGMLIPALLRRLGNAVQDATLGLAIAVILLVAAAHALHVSPVLAALAFGLVARHRRVVLSSAQRNFGALGDLLTVLLFVFAISTVGWNSVRAGAELGLLLVLARLLVKLAATTLFARWSGVSWRKGVLSGMALAPGSIFLMLILEQTGYLRLSLVNELPTLAAMALALEVLGPICTQAALVWAKETPHANEVKS